MPAYFCHRYLHFCSHDGSKHRRSWDPEYLATECRVGLYSLSRMKTQHPGLCPPVVSKVFIFGNVKTCSTRLRWSQLTSLLLGRACFCFLGYLHHFPPLPGWAWLSSGSSSLGTCSASRIRSLSPHQWQHTSLVLPLHSLPVGCWLCVVMMC